MKRVTKKQLIMIRSNITVSNKMADYKKYHLDKAVHLNSRIMIYTVYHYHHCHVIDLTTRKRVFGVSEKGSNQPAQLQSIGPVKKNNLRKIVIIFLSISLNICFWC